ncbi:hypothetical protein HNR74_004218 [Flammeovirga kamogawensis]|nr:hypothetical protein [Flammeovirga kamogawensis]
MGGSVNEDINNTFGYIESINSRNLKGVKSYF